MRINPINNITKKALPLAAAAAVGLGALTACSSSKNEKQEVSYVQTEMLKLDNTLDSLKTVKNKDDIAFFDYYEKSKEIIEESELDNKKTMDSKPAKALTYGGITLLLIGWGTALSGVLSKSLSPKTVNRGLVTVLAGGLTALAGIVGQNFKSWCDNTDFDYHKEQKLEQLENEKTEYLKTSDLNINY